MFINFDAVIILGHHMNASGHIAAETKKRIDKALELESLDKNFIYITSGCAYRNDVEISLAKSMKNYMLNKGISDERILISEDSRDTVGDAVFSRIRFANPLKWKSIIVVTSDYHVTRAKEIFNFVYGDSCKIEFIECSSSKRSKVLNEIKSLDIFRQTFNEVNPGNLFEIINVLTTKHPYYVRCKI